MDEQNRPPPPEHMANDGHRQLASYMRYLFEWLVTRDAALRRQLAERDARVDALEHDRSGWKCMCSEGDAEIERLGAEAQIQKECNQAWHDGADVLHGEIKELRAEVKRLKAENRKLIHQWAKRLADDVCDATD